MRLSNACLASLLLTLSAAAAVSPSAAPGAGAPAPCCNSSGSVTPFLGAIDDSRSLSAVLLARSFRREIILLADFQLGPMQQGYLLLHRLGLHHVLLIMLDQLKCEASSKLLPNLGCCWSSMPLPRGVSGSRKISALRTITAARIVSLGFNLLLLDSDTLVLRDPYEFLKAPPFSTHHLVAMRGAMPRTSSSAAMYLQGAAASGPVECLMEEAAIRTLRWAEYGLLPQAGSILKAFSDSSPSGCPEASLFTDVLLSSMLSRAVHWNCFRPSPAVAQALGVGRRLPQAMHEWDNGHAAALGLGSAGFKGLFQRQVVKIANVSLQALAMSKSFTLYSAPLRPGPQGREGQGEEAAMKEHAVYEAISQHTDGPSIRHLRKLLAADRALRATQDADAGAGAGVGAGGGRHLHAQHAARVAAGTQGLPAVQELQAGEAVKAVQAELQGQPEEPGAVSSQAGISSVGLPALAQRATSTPLRPRRQQVAAAAAAEEAVQQQWERLPCRPGSLPTRQLQQGERGASGPLGSSGTAAPGSAAQAAAAAAAAAAPAGSELFAVAPDWLFGSWSDRGVLGYWDPGLAGSPPRQVVASLSRVGGTNNAGWYAVRMAFGYFDWGVVHQQSRLQGGSTGPGALPKLVALSPSLVQQLASGAAAAGPAAEAAWLAALRGLVQVAALSGRMVVWPDLPCNASWLDLDPGSGGRLPLKPNHQVVAYGSLQRLRCLPQRYLSHHCLHVFSNTWLRSPWAQYRPGRREEEVPLRGMLEVEAAHVVELVGRGAARPGEKNTVNFARGGAAQQLQAPGGGSGKWWEGGGGAQRLRRELEGEGSVEVVRAEDVRRVLGDGEGSQVGGMDGEVVVYLERAVAVDDVPLQAGKRIAALLSKCPVFLQPAPAAAA